MPFKSDKQKGFMFANKPVIAKKFVEDSFLPKKKKKKKIKDAFDD